MPQQFRFGTLVRPRRRLLLACLFVSCCLAIPAAPASAKPHEVRIALKDGKVPLSDLSDSLCRALLSSSLPDEEWLLWAPDIERDPLPDLPNKQFRGRRFLPGKAQNAIRHARGSRLQPWSCGGRAGKPQGRRHDYGSQACQLCSAAAPRRSSRWPDVAASQAEAGRRCHFRPHAAKAVSAFYRHRPP